MIVCEEVESLFIFFFFEDVTNDRMIGPAPIGSCACWQSYSHAHAGSTRCACLIIYTKQKEQQKRNDMKVRGGRGANDVCRVQWRKWG